MRPVLINQPLIVVFSGSDINMTSQCSSSWSDIKEAIDGGRDIKLRYLTEYSHNHSYSDLTMSVDFNRDNELQRVQGGVSVVTLLGDSATVMTVICEVTQHNIHCTQQEFNLPLGGSNVR